MPDLSPEESSLVGAITELIEQREKNAREDSRTNGKVLRRFVLVKDAVVAIVFFASLLGAAAVMFQRLAEKPTMREMEEAVETRVAPVEKVQSEQAKTITTIESDVNRTKQVQEVVLEQNAYQGKVLEHIANKKRGDPPGKPKELERKETELMK